MNALPILDTPQTSTAAPHESGPAAAKGTYAFVSLGCPKNLVDSERMLGKLAIDGYRLVSEPEGADFVVVNTCGFIGPSREESKSVVREMLDLKASGGTGGVVVAGCLPERVGGESLHDELPGIDHVMGVFARDEIAAVADGIVSRNASKQSHLAREQRSLFKPAAIRAMDDTERLRITPSHYAYLKISEGCDRTCTFCSIPMMRGKHVTKPIEKIVAEARELAADGVKELILVAQDTTYYGLDLYGEVRLVELLHELERVDGIEWVRLMYLYPIHFTDRLIDTIAASEKIIPYLDMPLQHINSRVLKRMSRRVDRDAIVMLTDKLRSQIPNLVMRTTFVVGFPGETDAQFDELCDYVRHARFERLGVFPFSPEPGTPAMRLDGHLPHDVAAARCDELMAVQQPMAFEFAESLVGYELDALIDGEAGVADDGTPLYTGRLYTDAPEIDATVTVAGACEVGSFAPVELVAADGYDWHGVVGGDEE